MNVLSLKLMPLLMATTAESDKIIKPLGHHELFIEYILYDRDRLNLATELAHDMVEQQANLGRSFGSKVNGCVVEGSRPEQEILEFARLNDVDLIVLGSDLRQVTGRVF